MEKDLGNLAEQVAHARRLDAAYARLSLLYYLQSVMINSAPEPLPFGLAAEPWQRELIAPKVPAFEYLAGLNPGYWSPEQEARGEAGPLSFFDVLPRGHDKSSLEGRLLSWLLIAARKPIHAYILAADADQGALILQAMQDEARLNPWVYEYLKFSRRTVTGPAGFVEVVPADSGSAWGFRGNLYICDEITNWPDRGIEMWKAVVSGREKIPGTLLCILSNAGLLDSWQYEVRMAARADPDFVVFEREGQLASWMTPARVDKVRLLLPPSEAERVFDNKWIDPATEHDYLRRAEVDGCVAAARELGLLIKLRREPGVSDYVAAIDYGPKRDRTALCVVHLDKDRRCLVDRLDVWQGSPESPVGIDRVEQWIKDINRAFRPSLWVLDPYNLEGTCQWMEREHLPLERFSSRGGAGNFELAQHLRSVVVNRQLLWYPTAGELAVTKYGRTVTETFADELVGLRVKRMPYGFRFDHKSQRHDDRAVAVGMAALRAFQYQQAAAVAPRKLVLPPGDPGPGYQFLRNPPTPR